VREDTGSVKTKILIVEDESIVAKDFPQRLRSLGYDVLSIASTGESAINQIEKNRPDIVLMDIKLKSGMDGIETAEHIHNRLDIPVVYLTAYADDRTLERAKITEPFGYIIKPVEDTELKSAIELALYRHTAEVKLELEQQRVKELTHKIITAQEEERLYLASEIHDDLVQGLVAVLYFLQMIDLSSLDQKTQNQKKELIKIIKSSIGRCRSLISEIEPLREPKMGLIRAIKKSIDQKFVNADIKVHLDYPIKIPKINLLTKTNILRIIQEALMNVQKHADATEVFVKITISKGKLKLKVKDNGIGFNPKSIPSKTTPHYGLLTMQERTQLIGGELTLSSRPGKGTTIKGIFPLISR